MPRRTAPTMTVARWIAVTAWVVVMVSSASGQVPYDDESACPICDASVNSVVCDATGRSYRNACFLFCVTSSTNFAACPTPAPTAAPTAPLFDCGGGSGQIIPGELVCDGSVDCFIVFGADEEPTMCAARAPTASPSRAPSAAPTRVPTELPTAAPSAVPTAIPTSTAPTVAPTASPSRAPSAAPTRVPTEVPTVAPTAAPTSFPTSAAPTASPTRFPTFPPVSCAVGEYMTAAASSTSPTQCRQCSSCGAGEVEAAPCLAARNTLCLSDDPLTSSPFGNTSVCPMCSTAVAEPICHASTRAAYFNRCFLFCITGSLSGVSCASVTLSPTTVAPTSSPTRVPTAIPTATPTAMPTAAPTAMPTHNPTTSPTASPTAAPTVAPSALPTAMPTHNPTHSPTTSPTATPTVLPSAAPTHVPTLSPTAEPTSEPTVFGGTCPPGRFAPVGVTTCTPHRVCANGTYQVVAPTTTTDRFCYTARTCSEGEFMAAPFTSTSDTDCRTCSGCSVGEVATENCTTVHDTVCEPDSTGRSNNTNGMGPCQARCEYDTTAALCKPTGTVTPCTAYAVEACPSSRCTVSSVGGMAQCVRTPPNTSTSVTSFYCADNTNVDACDVLPHCSWDYTTAMCEQRACNTAYTNATCGQLPGCSYDSQLFACYESNADIPCAALWIAARCQEAASAGRCTWNAAESTCAAVVANATGPPPCQSYATTDLCTAQAPRCEYIAGGPGCVSTTAVPACSSYTSASSCPVAGTEYETGTASDGGALCRPLSPLGCDEGYYNTAPTATTDRECAMLTACDASEFESTPPTPTSDRVCTTAAVYCTPDVIEGPSDGTDVGEAPVDTTVATQTTAVDAGEAPLESTTAAVGEAPIETTTTMTTMPTTSSVPNTPLVGPYVDESNWTSAYYIVAPATPTSDLRCRRISACDPTEYETMSPTTTTDRTCRAATVCTPLLQYESVALTPTSDRVCTAVTPCLPRTEFQSVAPGATNDRICSLLTVCDESTQFESSPPTYFGETAISDRVCSTITDCVSGEYEFRGPTPTSDRICRRFTQCGPGTVEVCPPVPWQDRLCVDAGIFVDPTASELELANEESGSGDDLANRFNCPTTTTTITTSTTTTTSTTDAIGGMRSVTLDFSHSLAWLESVEERLAFIDSLRDALRASGVSNIVTLLYPRRDSMEVTVTIRSRGALARLRSLVSSGQFAVVYEGVSYPAQFESTTTTRTTSTTYTETTTSATETSTTGTATTRTLTTQTRTTPTSVTATETTATHTTTTSTISSTITTTTHTSTTRTTTTRTITSTTVSSTTDTSTTFTSTTTISSTTDTINEMFVASRAGSGTSVCTTARNGCTADSGCAACVGRSLGRSNVVSCLRLNNAYRRFIASCAPLCDTARNVVYNNASSNGAFPCYLVLISAASQTEGVSQLSSSCHAEPQLTSILNTCPASSLGITAAWQTALEGSGTDIGSDDDEVNESADNKSGSSDKMFKTNTTWLIIYAVIGVIIVGFILVAVACYQRREREDLEAMRSQAEEEFQGGMHKISWGLKTNDDGGGGEFQQVADAVIGATGARTKSPDDEVFDEPQPTGVATHALAAGSPPRAVTNAAYTNDTNGFVAMTQRLNHNVGAAPSDDEVFDEPAQMNDGYLAIGGDGGGVGGLRTTTGGASSPTTVHDAKAQTWSTAL